MNAPETDPRAGRLPERMCVICRRRFDKDELTRFVFLTGTVPAEDIKQILPGRGYYVCADGGCREKWLRRAGRGKRGTRA